MNEIAWRDFVAALTAAILVAGLFLAWIRWQLSTDFARKPDIDGLSTRIGTIETQMKGAPTHVDMRALADRIAAVESSVGIVGAEIRGVRDGIARVERDLAMLVNHHLGRPE